MTCSRCPEPRTWGVSQIEKQHLSTTATVLTIIGFNLITLILIEVPLLSYVIAPDWTPGAVDRAKAWAVGRTRRLAVAAFACSARRSPSRA